MDLTGWLLVALLGMGLITLLVVLRTRRRPGSSEGTIRPTINEVGSVVAVPPGMVDYDALVAALEVPGPVGAEPVLFDLEDGTALVLADTAQAQSFGEVVGRAGPRLVSNARRLSSATELGIAAAERSGLLVRLHPDSAKALKALKADQVKDASGYIYTSLRGSNGKYRHVVRIKDVAGLQTLSSGAAVISALAMQAQLDRIEKQLAQIQAGVSEVQRNLDVAAAAEREALDALIAEIYRTAHETGQLTPAQWDQIAPHIKETYKLRHTTLRDLENLEREIRQLPKQARERSEKLGELSERFSLLVRRLDEDDRRVGQSQVLRLWHLSVQQDPSLPATLADTRMQVEQRLRSRAALLGRVEAVARDTDVRGMQAIHNRRRRAIRESGFSISILARERRLALPSGLREDPSEGLSPEEIALSYTLTPDEALVLVIAQGWLMSQCAEDDAGRADTERFLAEAAEAVAGLERAALSASSVGFVEQLSHRDSQGRLSYVQDFGALESLAAARVSTRVRSLLLLIELWGFHPWSPKDQTRPLKTARTWNEDKREEGIRRISLVLRGVGETDQARLQTQSRESAELLFRGSMLVPMVLLLVGGVGAGVLTAGLAAPVVGAAIGSSMFGLSGAAATSAGLAALGGGSLAAGGFGMAGGTALISAAGGVLGMGLGAGAAAGAHASADTQARVLGRITADVIKLHVLCVVVLIEELRDVAAVDAVIQGLRNRRQELHEIVRSRPESGQLRSKGADLRGNSAHEEAAVDFKEETKRLKTVEQVLTRAIDDLLKRRGVLVRQSDAQGG